MAGSRTWVTETVVKPTLIDPLRARPPLLDATENATVPLPLPLAPEVIDIHGALAVELQEQSLSVDTLIERVPPVNANEPPPGLSV